MNETKTDLERLTEEVAWLRENYTAKSKWMHGHYHCRKCGGELPCWQGFSWDGRFELGKGYGVSRIGGCQRCGQVMVEYENAPPVWVEVVL